MVLKLFSCPQKFIGLLIQQIVDIISLQHQGLDLTLQCCTGQLQFLLFGSVFIIAVFQFLFISYCKVFVLVQLIFKFGLAVDDFVFFVVSHLVSFNHELLHFPSSVVDDLLQLIDFAIEQIELILVRAFQ